MDTKKAEEELAFIKKAMEDSRRTIQHKGMDGLIWGIFLFLACEGSFLVLHLDLGFSAGLIWLVFIVIGIVYHLWIQLFTKQARENLTFSGKMIYASITANMVPMCIIGFIGAGKGMPDIYLGPIFSAIMGAMQFMIGSVANSRTMKSLAIIWWIGSIVMFFINTYFNYAVLGLLFLFLQVIPGIAMIRKARKTKSN